MSQADPGAAVPVLLVSVSGIAGGAERALAALARGLPERGYRPEVALGATGPLGEWLADGGCPSIPLPVGRLRNPFDVWRTVDAIRRHARRMGARLILANGSPDQVYAGIAARTLGLPSVWWQQIVPGVDFGGPRMTRSFVDRAAARVPVTLVVATSRATAAAQRDETPRARVEVVHLGIDVAGVRAHAGAGARVRGELGAGTDPVVGIVGWVWPWKGQDVFLRAARQVADRRPDARFVVVGGTGDPGFRERLDELVDELDLGDRVSFVGHRPDVYDWFDALDVAVHASWGEAFGLVIAEAMALGKPVVATEQGGPSEIVDAGVTGTLVAPGDHVAMGNAVIAYLDDPALRARVGSAAAEAADRFSVERMVDGMAALFDDVLAVR